MQALSGRQRLLKRALVGLCVCGESEVWTGSRCSPCLPSECAGWNYWKPLYASYVTPPAVISNASCDWLCDIGYTEANGFCVSCLSCAAGKHQTSCGYEKVELAVAPAGPEGPVTWYQFDGNNLDSGSRCFAMEGTNVEFSSDSRSAQHHPAVQPCECPPELALSKPSTRIACPQNGGRDFSHLYCPWDEQDGTQRGVGTARFVLVRGPPHANPGATFEPRRVVQGAEER